MSLLLQVFKSSLQILHEHYFIKSHSILLFFFFIQALVPKVVSFTQVKKCNHAECSDKIRSVERSIKCRLVGQLSFNIKDAGG